MKKLLFLLFLAGICRSVSAQETAPLPVQRQVFTVVEQMPEFPGGNSALHKYLSKKIKYPKKARQEKTEGQVVIRFIVEPDGSLSNPEVLNKVGDGCEEALLRVIRKMPKWNPGRQTALLWPYTTLYPFLSAFKILQGINRLHIFIIV